MNFAAKKAELQTALTAVEGQMAQAIGIST
jgi:hypothetical protein